jgi:hypothetical protein
VARRIDQFSEPTQADLFKVQVYNHPGFRYTTPSASREKLSAGDKRKIGCYEKPVTKYCFKGDSGKNRCVSVRMEAESLAKGKPVFPKVEKKFTGGRCPGESNVCPEDDQVYDVRCKGKDDPCGSDRSTCPVQLVWVEGKPNLRFCIRKNQPGYLVPVKNVKEAMEISGKACSKWPYQLGAQERAEGSEEEGWDPEFFDKNAPDVRQKARAAYPAWKGLGGVGRPQKRPSPWLAIGLAMGLTAAVLLNKRGQSGTTPST